MKNRGLTPGQPSPPRELLFLLRRGVEINAAVYQAAVKACACSGGMTRAIFLMKDAMKRGTPVTPAAVAETIIAVIKQGRGSWQQALSLYEAFVELVVGQGRQVRAAGPISTPGEGVGSLNSVDSLPGAARRIHMLSESASALEEVCQAALEACCVGGQCERAVEVLNTLRAGGLGGQRSMAAYEKAIVLCGKGRAWEKVGSWRLICVRICRPLIRLHSGYRMALRARRTSLWYGAPCRCTPPATW